MSDGEQQQHVDQGDVEQVQDQGGEQDLVNIRVVSPEELRTGVKEDFVLPSAVDGRRLGSKERRFIEQQAGRFEIDVYENAHVIGEALYSILSVKQKQEIAPLQEDIKDYARILGLSVVTLPHITDEQHRKTCQLHQELTRDRLRKKIDQLDAFVGEVLQVQVPNTDRRVCIDPAREGRRLAFAKALEERKKKELDAGKSDKEQKSNKRGRGRSGRARGRGFGRGSYYSQGWQPPQQQQQQPPPQVVGQPYQQYQRQWQSGQQQPYQQPYRGRGRGQGRGDRY
jgi:hypothetical protein